MIIPSNTVKFYLYKNNPVIITQACLYQFTSNGNLVYINKCLPSNEIFIINNRIFSIQSHSINEYNGLDFIDVENKYDMDCNCIDSIVPTEKNIFIIYGKNDMNVLFDLKEHKTILEFTGEYYLCNNLFYYLKDDAIYEINLENNSSKLIYAALKIKRFYASNSKIVFCNNNHTFVYDLKTENLSQYHAHSCEIQKLYLDDQDRMVYSVCKEKILQFNIAEEVISLILNNNNDFISMHQTRESIFIHKETSLIFYDKILRDIKYEIVFLDKNVHFLGYFMPGSTYVKLIQSDIIPTRNKKTKIIQQPVKKLVLRNEPHVIFSRLDEILIFDLHTHLLMQRYKLDKKIIRSFFNNDTLLTLKMKTGHISNSEISIDEYKINAYKITLMSQTDLKRRFNINEIESIVFNNNLIYLKMKNKVMVFNKNGNVNQVIYNITQFIAYKEIMYFLNGRKSISCDQGNILLKHPIHAFGIYCDVIFFINAKGFYEFNEGRTKILLKGKFKHLSFVHQSAILAKSKGGVIYSMSENTVIETFECANVVTNVITNNLLQIENNNYCLQNETQLIFNSRP